MNFKKIFSPACLTTGLLLAFPISAGAVTFGLSAGSNGGTSGQGTFSAQPGVSTVDFNSGTVNRANDLGGADFTYSSGSATYTWREPGLILTGSPTTNLVSDSSAPPGPGGVANNSRYLAINGNPVTVNFSTPLKYFGLDWGNADADDQIQFYTGNTLLNTFTASSVFGTPLPTNPQPSSYVDFFASGTTETFNRVVLTHLNDNDAANPAFQSDNHAFSTQAQAVPFGFSPGLGILALGFWGASIELKRQRRNNPKLLNWLLSK